MLGDLVLDDPGLFHRIGIKSIFHNVPPFSFYRLAPV
jgi:hypothetical protein